VLVEADETNAAAARQRAAAARPAPCSPSATPHRGHSRASSPVTVSIRSAAAGPTAQHVGVPGVS